MKIMNIHYTKRLYAIYMNNVADVAIKMCQERSPADSILSTYKNILLGICSNNVLEGRTCFRELQSHLLIIQRCIHQVPPVYSLCEAYFLKIASKGLRYVSRQRSAQDLTDNTQQRDLPFCLGCCRSRQTNIFTGKP